MWVALRPGSITLSQSSSKPGSVRARGPQHDDEIIKRYVWVNPTKLGDRGYIRFVFHVVQQIVVADEDPPSRPRSRA